MPKKKYNVTLSPAEESFLKSITHKGKNYSAREIIHAQVLLHSNDNRPQDKKDNRILAEWLGISPATKPLQLLGEIRERISAAPMHTDPDTHLPKPGYCEKIDSEYVRCGTAGIFMFTEPLGGWRHVSALEHRTKGDYAKMMRQVAEEYYADCNKIILVSDNLNTHSKASFYEAFPPETAYKLSQKYEMHYTPKHGSWLNIAETELSSLTIQCLGNRRINSLEELNSIISAWECGRNQKQIGVNWQFTAEDARIKLKRLYPAPIFDE